MALSRDEVVTGALTLLDKVGLDALTMRRLAQALGVQAGAIYWHFKNKQELIDAMADAIMGELVPPPATLSWDQKLGEVTRHMTAALMKRRDAARLTSTALRPGPNTLRYAEAMLSIIAASGKSQEQVLWIASAVGYYTIGFVTDMQAQADAVRQRGLEKLIRDFKKELDPVAFPELAKFTPRQFAEMMKPGQAQARFEFGLEVLLRGLTSDGATAKGASAGTKTRARKPHRRR
jgi:TetR/AcrR family tetracycline transcriptional repressor